MHSVLTTTVFEADAKSAGLSEDEIMAIVITLSERPQSGDIIPEPEALVSCASPERARARAEATGQFISMAEMTFPFFCWRL